jgi:hypothetical protein
MAECVRDQAEPLNYPPEIIDFSPPPSVCTETDSTVLLTVNAVDINGGDVLAYAWSIKGVTDPAAHDSLYAHMSPVSIIPGACRPYFRACVPRKPANA